VSSRGPNPSRTMTRVIAAVADDSAASAVLSSAGAIAPLFSATVEALHVGEERAAPAAAAREAGVTLRTVAGEVVETIVRAAGAEDVAAVVIGARGAPGGRRPAGGTALALVTSLNKPVAVVPPDATVKGPVESVLVPLDATASSAAALREIVELAANAELRIVVAHVQQAWSLPPFSDHLPHEVRAWSEEFMARYCPSAIDAALELRVGEPHEHVLDILRASGCDLVALGWSQDLAGGRAAVVRRLLAESPVPVLLTPVAATPTAVGRSLEGAATHARGITTER
jgi:nucleotide-binding universal stress UspA family protein